jgi:hypothetical protein
MTPAFSSPGRAAAFAALLLALLAAPALVGRLGVLDRADVYPTIPVGAGPFAHIQRQVFDETAALDIAFVGSSFMWSGIDAPYVQRELTRALGREARVTVLASVWPGLDRDYVLLKDLLSRRSVELVVLQFPNRNRPTDDPAAEANRVADEPHVQAFRFYRAGELDEVDAALPSRPRAALYAGAVLGMPRHLLTLARPNYTSPAAVEATLGARLETRGYYGAPFERFRPDPPQFDADEMIYSGSDGAAYRFFEEPLPPYQMHFAKLIGTLLAEHDVPAVVLHIPQANETTVDVVEERLDWRELTGVTGPLIGIPPARLFAGFDAEEVERFFVSDHLNENGTIYFTRAVTPALLQAFADHEAAD